MPDFQFDFACVEHADYDAVIRWRRRADQFFTPIQLKEYVPITQLKSTVAQQQKGPVVL
jgi:hypothetical protein